jgi:hypothetical protein
MSQDGHVEVQSIELQFPVYVCEAVAGAHLREVFEYAKSFMERSLRDLNKEEWVLLILTRDTRLHWLTVFYDASGHLNVPSFDDVRIGKCQVWKRQQGFDFFHKMVLDFPGCVKSVYQNGSWRNMCCRCHSQADGLCPRAKLHIGMSFEHSELEEDVD